MNLPLVSVVSCEGCGACCMSAGLPPGAFRLLALGFAPEYSQSLPDASIWGGMSEELREELRVEFRREQEQARRATAGRSSPCLWFDRVPGRCMHYEHRPTVCRDFPVGGHLCLMERAYRGVQ